MATTLKKSELINLFGNHYAFNFELLNLVINTKNLKKVIMLIEKGYSPVEIKENLS